MSLRSNLAAMSPTKNLWPISTFRRATLPIGCFFTEKEILWNDRSSGFVVDNAPTAYCFVKSAKENPVSGITPFGMLG